MGEYGGFIKMEKYDEFLSKKLNYGHSAGVDIEPFIHEMLFDYQKDTVKWALKKGRCALFLDCGLGKTFCQLTYADNISKYTQGKIIIFAPLSVNNQTIEEGKRINIDVSRFDVNDDVMIKIANYENIEKINPNDYVGIVLDESSILKAVDSKTRRRLVEFCKDIEFRMACTATPAPNDISEIANHTEFLGIMKREEMLAKWFFNNGSDWVLKGHAIDKFYEWMATWAMFMTKPSDLGYSDDGFELPEMEIKPLYFDYEFKDDGDLFSRKLKGIEDRMKIRKETVYLKAGKIADIVNQSDEQFIIWCGIDLEANTISKLIKDSVNLKGKDSIETKIDVIDDFKSGKTRVLVTKPKIAGHGMNFQNSHNAIFFGLSDSYESYYQCIRRQYRFGQKKKVEVIISLATGESVVLENVMKKEKQSNEISNMVIRHIKKYEMEELGMKHEQIKYEENRIHNDYYDLRHGDSCEVLKTLDENSVDFSIFSPPFQSLFTYSNSDRDLGNCSTEDEFFNHFRYIVKELYRVIKTGRNIAVHCMNLPTKKIVDGYIGIKDFRGDIIRLFQGEGFIYHSEVCIQKNPQVAAIRTHAKGLMFKQMHKDSAESRVGIPDYICVFKKPGENKIPIKCDLNNEEWIKFAHPIWTDIRETYTLNSIKADKDEKHMCPLQLDVIERCIRLWSGKGEIVLSPFMGICSEGVKSIDLGRKFIGIELKKEYFEQSEKNIDRALSKKQEFVLF